MYWRDGSAREKHAGVRWSGVPLNAAAESNLAFSLLGLARHGQATAALSTDRVRVVGALYREAGLAQCTERILHPRRPMARGMGPAGYALCIPNPAQHSQKWIEREIEELRGILRKQRHPRG